MSQAYLTAPKSAPSHSFCNVSTVLSGRAVPVRLKQSYPASRSTKEKLRPRDEGRDSSTRLPACTVCQSRTEAGAPRCLPERLLVQCHRRVSGLCYVSVTQDGLCTECIPILRALLAIAKVDEAGKFGELFGRLEIQGRRFRNRQQGVLPSPPARSPGFKIRLLSFSTDKVTLVVIYLYGERSSDSSFLIGHHQAGPSGLER